MCQEAFRDISQKFHCVIFFQRCIFVKFTVLGLNEIREFTGMDETTTRPYNQVLLDLYSGGEALGFGIGLGGARY